MQSVDSVIDAVRELLKAETPAVPEKTSNTESALPVAAVAAAAPSINSRHIPLLLARDELAQSMAAIEAARQVAGAAEEFRRRLDAMQYRAAEVRKRVAEAIHEADMVFVLAMLGDA